MAKKQSATGKDEESSSPKSKHLKADDSNSDDEDQEDPHFVIGGR